MIEAAYDRQRIESMHEFQGGATILPKGFLGYVLQFPDSEGKLGDPIYVLDPTYSKICTEVAVNKGSVTLMLLSTGNEVPQKGYYGTVIPKE